MITDTNKPSSPKSRQSSRFVRRRNIATSLQQTTPADQCGQPPRIKINYIIKSENHFFDCFLGQSIGGIRHCWSLVDFDPINALLM